MSDLKIKQTSDYSKFKTLKGNRYLNENHVEQLMASMKKQYILSPIQVNEKMEIIDGQHRLEAAKRLQLEVYYIILDGATIDTVQSLNTNSKNWNVDDYVKCYQQLGYQEYINFKAFCEEYEYPVTGALIVCGIYGFRNVYNTIATGKLRIPDIGKAYDLANHLKKIRPYYKGYKRRQFLHAICRCIKKKNFTLEEFISKLSFQSLKMVDCATSEQYVELIEEIYNYKRSDKVNLRIEEKD